MANSAPRGLWCPHQNFQNGCLRQKKHAHYGNAVVCEPKLSICF